MKKFVSLLIILVLALSLGVSALAGDREDAESYMESGKKWEGWGNFARAADYYYSAADHFMDAEMYKEARAAYEDAKRCFTACGDDYWAGRMQDYIDEIDEEHPVTGSTLSQGTLAIVTAVAGLAVGLVGGWFLFGRKKKTVEG